MRSAVVLVALVLVGYASAATNGSERSLMSRRRGGGVSADCSAASRLRIQVHSGSCYGSAQADCNAYASARSQVAKDIREWFATKECQKGDLEAYARAHAYAVASVLVKAQVNVQCDGQGYACGYAIAKGSGLAKGFAKAQALAFVDADPNAEHAGTFCESDVEALGDVYAEALEKARVAVCQQGYGQQSDIEYKFAKSVECAIASAYARAEAEYCTKKGWGDYAGVRAESKCTGRGEVLRLCKGY